DAEPAAVSACRAAAAHDIRLRGEKAGAAAKDVLEAQAFMAEGPTLVDAITARLAPGRTAERAVHEAFAGFRDLLLSMGGYMGERATGLDAVSQRVVAHLQGGAAPGVPDPDQAFVLVARALAPADTALLD
ncbi:phosphoenolpyruvate-utilizing N-terminal domain-containing protein, partial [Clavibacter michiganensis]|uniref:phosphoenolpyruvate-utilizing N-terminal domain-containing protein n=1 Tax=Clavibacter michiganensis TaxID=28447 RepID=UPI003F69053D